VNLLLLTQLCASTTLLPYVMGTVRRSYPNSNNRRSTFEENDPPRYREELLQSYASSYSETFVAEGALPGSEGTFKIDSLRASLRARLAHTILPRDAVQNLKTLFETNPVVETPGAPFLRFAALASQPCAKTAVRPPLKELSNGYCSLRISASRRINIGSDTSPAYLDGPAESSVVGSPALVSSSDDE